VNVDLSHPSYEGFTTPRTAAPRGIWHHYGRSQPGCPRAGGSLRFSRRQCRNGGGVEPGAAAFCGCCAVSWVLPVRGRDDLDADGGAARRRADRAGVPHNSGQTGSMDCPIFRGALAVNPLTGDTFAWTVDVKPGPGAVAGCVRSQQRRMRQCEHHLCAALGTQVLETITAGGPATIADGDYTLALAAVPAAAQQGADTLLLAGAERPVAMQPGPGLRAGATPPMQPPA
jgi:hypothetical protein